MNKKRITRLLVLLCGLFPFALSAQTSCENISIQTIDNELVISNLNVANTKLRVFDPNYNLVFSCEFDCTANIDIAGASDGDIYHLTFEFFSDNFSYLVQENIDYTIGDAALEIGICTGNVTLANQSEVDAFCGCEIITGLLDVGDRFTQNNDIDNISNLNNLKAVEDIVITGSNLTSLAELENLKIARGLRVFRNPVLTSLDAFNQMEVIQDIQITGNPSLQSLNAFQQLKEVQLILFLNSNSQLTALNGLGNLEIVNGFSFENNDAFEVLDELVALKTVGKSISIRINDQLKEVVFSELSGNVDRILIADNPLLASLPAIGGLTISDDLQILDNPSLDECCALATLIDADQSNGHNAGILSLRGNGNMCNSTLDIIENCGGTTPADCDAITIKTSNNQLIINNINAPISIVKVYDQSYRQVFACNNNCETEIIISDLLTCEDYTIDVQLYDENYGLICDRKFSQVVEGQPANSLVCQGSVILNSQADVDNFCGCAKIEGSLFIGRNDANDISDLSNLASVEEVTELLFIKKTQLVNLTNLNVKKVGRSMTISENPLLADVNVFDEFEITEFINISSNPNLQKISGFSQTSILESISILSNDNLTDISGFGNLKTAYNININQNSQLAIIDAFPNLEESTVQVYIVGNDNLKQVAFPQLKTTAVFHIEGNLSLETVELADNFSITAFLRVYGNTSLTDCCFLKPLVDDDLTNGTVGFEVAIRDNGNSCNSVMEIMDNCSSPPSNCDNTTIVSSNNQLTISAITASNAIVKVFDNNWQLVFECNANCEETIMLDNLNSGDIYHTDIQFYDANWQSICADKQDIEIQGGITNFCDEVTIALDENFRSITISNLTAPIEIVKVFNVNWQPIYECFADCEEPVQLIELSGDRYHIQVNMYDTNWTPICNIDETVDFRNNSESRTNELQPADFVLHPNPALEQTIINLQQLEGEAVTLKLFNQFGQEVYQKSIGKVTESREAINLSSFSNGLYLLQIQSKGRKAISKKLVVNRLY